MNQPELFLIDRPPPIATPPSGCKKIGGTAAEPGTGPKGETCKTCAHYVVTRPGAGKYRKCGLMREHWTSGPGTDIKAGYPACKFWESAAANKPFGHSAWIIRRVRTAAKLPLDRTYYEDRVQIRRRGSRKTLERAVRLVRGFIRMDGEIEAYTAEQWVRAFGTGNELGTPHGRVDLARKRG